MMPKAKSVNKPLTLGDISVKYRKKVYGQKYAPSPLLEGVKLISLLNIPGEEGDLSEIVRINMKSEVSSIPGFKIAQLNRTRLIPNSVKAWHLHFKQDFIWYVNPYDHLFVGLWDLRKNSKTEDKIMRIVLGGGQSQLLFIPHGVAQGSAVFQNTPVDLFVFSNTQFEINNLDEKRLPWNSKGKNFWLPKRD